MPAAGCSWPTAPLLRDPREAALATRGVAGLAPCWKRPATSASGDRLRGGAGAEDLNRRRLPGVEVAGVATFLAAVGDGQIVTALA